MAWELDPQIISLCVLRDGQLADVRQGVPRRAAVPQEGPNSIVFGSKCIQMTHPLGFAANRRLTLTSAVLESEAEAFSCT